MTIANVPASPNVNPTSPGSLPSSTTSSSPSSVTNSSPTVSVDQYDPSFVGPPNPYLTDSVSPSPAAVSSDADPTLQSQLNDSMTSARLTGPHAINGSSHAASSDEYGAITDHLSRDLTDWAVTDSDVQAVHEKLDGMSPEQYQETMQRLDNDGYLGTYVGNMDAEARSNFLTQAADKGYVGLKEGRSFEVPDGAPKPPDSPDLYRHSESLPSSVREAIHDENVANFNEYKGEYKNYIDDYSSQVMSASSPEEIREMGPPVNSVSPMEPGLKANDPMRDRWAREAIAFSPNHQPAYTAIGNRTDDLAGEIRPGSFYVSGEVAVQQDDDSGDTQFGMKAGGRLYQYGAAEAEVKGTASEIMGTPIGMDGGISGRYTPGGGVQVQPDGSVGAAHTFEIDEDSNSPLAGMSPLSASVDNNGKVELGMRAFGAETRYGEAEVSSYASSDPSSSTFEMGASGELGLGNTKVSVKGGVGLRGITADEIVESMNSPGFFED